MSKSTKKNEKMDYHARQVRRNQMIMGAVGVLVIVSMLVAAVASL